MSIINNNYLMNVNNNNDDYKQSNTIYQKYQTEKIENDIPHQYGNN